MRKKEKNFIINFIILPALLFFGFSSFASDKVLSIKHWQTENGAEVYFVSTASDLPVLNLKIAFTAGSAQDGDKQGLAALTNNLLDQGAANLTADEIAASFEELGARYGSDSQRDMATLSLRTLIQANLRDPAVDTFVKVLTRPDFPKAAFERKKQQQLIEIEQENQSASDVAVKKFYETIFGQHPYGHPVLGNANSLAHLTLNDVTNFYDRYYVARNATIAIVGPLTDNEATKLANKIAGSLKSGEPAPNLPTIQNPQALVNSVVEQVKFPATQTKIYMGHVGVDRQNKDYFPLFVGNHILGGGTLTSRLNKEIRENRGLSYGVYSMFIPMKSAGPFFIGLGTRNEQAEQAMTVARDVLKNFMTKEPPTKQEMIDAKQYLIGSFVTGFDSNAKIVDAVLALGFYHLPITYFDEYREHINAVTAEQIHAAFQRYVHLNKMVTVSVGGVSTPQRVANSFSSQISNDGMK